MPLETRLKQAFGHATSATSLAVDATLAELLATYRAQRRHRVMLIGAAAATALLVLVAGDSTVRWIQSLERDDIPPTEQNRDTSDERRGPEQRHGERDESAMHSARRLRERDRVVAFLGPLSSQRIEDSGLLEPVGNHTDGTTSARGDDRGTRGQEQWGPGTHPEFTRKQTEKWSNAPVTGNSGIAAFTIRADESYIRVRIEPSGGGGTSYPAGKVYEIVGGVSHLVAEFCRRSGLIEVTPGAEIEVRVSVEGCSGTDTWIKGLTTVRFYK